MTFGQAVKTCLTKYADFSGRASRSEYWWWILFQFIMQLGLFVSVLLAVLTSDSGLGQIILVGLAALFFVVLLTLIVPGLAVLVRRLHDTGRSGWYWFLGLVPVVGWIVLLVFLTTAGDPGSNAYGPALSGFEDKLVPDDVAALVPGFLTDIKVIRVVSQIVAVVIVFFLLRYFYGNLVENFNRLGISTSYGFLSSPTNFRITYHEEFDPRSPVWEMVLVGVKNTFLAGFFGIILASVVGLVVGVSRLSENWLINKAAMFYVETFRNIPPLVIIIFFGFAVFFYGPFPIFSESWEMSLPGSENVFLILNKDRWGVPGFSEIGNLTFFWVVLVLGVVAAVVVWRWRTRRFDRTGQPHHRVLWATGVILAFAIVGYFVTGQPFEVSYPSISEDRRLLDGGFAINWGFISVTAALGLYTASHIGEIIRGSILAIHTGQSEAANALALSGFQRYRFVVLPQAMRIALPPTINQYLNLVKNTSLGTAAAYAEITALTKTSIGNGRPTYQSIIIMMAVYLTFSLVISAALNVVNQRLKLVDR